MDWIEQVITAIIGFLGISLIREALKKTFPNIKDILDSFSDAVLITLVAATLIFSRVNHITEIKKEEKINFTIEAIKDYSDMARYDPTGTTGLGGPVIKETTPISRLLEGAFVIKDDKAFVKCDYKSLDKFQTVVKQFPTFPFSYYALAVCLRQVGDDASWKYYAHKAIEILEKTTTIAGHKVSHDQALKELQLLTIGTPLPLSK